jgi:hypothetical protein
MSEFWEAKVSQGSGGKKETYFWVLLKCTAAVTLQESANL